MTIHFGDSTSIASGGSLGKILQTKYVQSGSLTTISSSSYASVGGLNNTITPSSSSNKILLICGYNGGITNGSGTNLAIKIRFTQSIGGSVSSIYESNEDFQRYAIGNGEIDYMIAGQFFSYLDSPNTTSEITYNVQSKEAGGSGTHYVFSKSQLILLEVAA